MKKRLSRDAEELARVFDQVRRAARSADQVYGSGGDVIRRDAAAALRSVLARHEPSAQPFRAGNTTPP